MGGDPDLITEEMRPVNVGLIYISSDAAHRPAVISRRAAEWQQELTAASLLHRPQGELDLRDL